MKTSQITNEHAKSAIKHLMTTSKIIINYDIKAVRE